VQLFLGATKCATHTIDENLMYALITPPSNLSYDFISQKIVPIVAKVDKGHGFIARSDYIHIEGQRYWNVEFNVPITKLGSMEEEVMEYENLDGITSGTTISTRTYERLLPLFLNKPQTSLPPRKAEIEDSALQVLMLASDMQLLNDSFDMPHLVAPSKVDDKVGNEDIENPYLQYYTSSPSMYSKRERRLCHEKSLTSSSLFDYTLKSSMSFDISKASQNPKYLLLDKKRKEALNSWYYYNQKLHSMDYSQSLSYSSILDSLSLIRTMVNLETDKDSLIPHQQQSGRGHRRSNRLSNQKISSRYLHGAFRGIWTQEEEVWFKKCFMVYR